MKAGQLIAGGAVALMIAARASATTYSYTTLNPPGSLSSAATGINDAGVVTGTYSTSGGQFLSYIYLGGGYATLDVPGSTGTYAEAINASGSVAGDYAVGTNEYGFVYSAGHYSTISVADALETRVVGINASGTVVGDSYGPASAVGFIESDDAYTSIDVPGSLSTTAYAINSSGEVVGTYQTASGRAQGFTYAGGVYTTFSVSSLSVGTTPKAINASGVVTGHFDPGVPCECSPSFVYDGGASVALYDPSAYLTDARAINGSGAIAGNSSGDSLVPTKGFVYSSGVFTSIAPPAAFSTTVEALNDKGVVAGYYSTGSFYEPGYATAFIATPFAVPEPHAWTMLLVGLGGLGSRLRHFRGARRGAVTLQA